MNVTTGGKGPRLLLAGATYGVLFLLGAMEGLIGSFQYGRMAGRVPLAAITSCAVLLATCLLMAWTLRSVSGALVPAVGWMAASFVLSMPVSNGSVIIADSAAGRWYLYGGTACAVVAVAASFGLVSRAQS
jgi:hypothetical protein